MERNLDTEFPSLEIYPFVDTLTSHPLIAVFVSVDGGRHVDGEEVTLVQRCLIPRH